MTHESHNQSQQPFANAYPLPDDQFGFEAEARETFAQQFPGKEPLLNAALTEVHRYAGFDSPQYKVQEEDMVPAIMDNVADDLGYLNLGTDRGGGMSLLTLTMPDRTVTPEAFENMSDIDRRVAGAKVEGMSVVGAMPPETVAMLESVYGAIGAKVVRDDRAEGAQSGSVLREGEYQGEPIFVVEDYHNNQPHLGGRDSLSVRIVGTDMARKVKDELSDSEVAAFATVTGLALPEARQEIRKNGVDRTNVANVVDVLRQTQAVLGAAQTEPQGVSKAEQSTKAPNTPEQKVGRLTSAARRIGRILGRRQQ